MAKQVTNVYIQARSVAIEYAKWRLKYERTLQLNRIRGEVKLDAKFIEEKIIEQNGTNIKEASIE